MASRLLPILQPGCIALTYVCMAVAARLAGASRTEPSSSPPVSKARGSARNEFRAETLRGGSARNRRKPEVIGAIGDDTPAATRSEDIKINYAHAEGVSACRERIIFSAGGYKNHRFGQGARIVIESGLGDASLRWALKIFRANETRRLALIARARVLLTDAARYWLWLGHR